MDSTGAAAAAGAGMVILVIELAILVLMVASIWKIFEKAGQPGWAAIVPFYNIYVMLEVAGKPGWWLVLMFIPFVNIVIEILMLIGLAEKFGKSGGFAVGLILLGIVFLPILAFGDAKYVG